MQDDQGRIGRPHWDSLLDLSVSALRCANDAGGTAEEVVARAETYLKFLASRVMHLDERGLPYPETRVAAAREVHREADSSAQ